MRTANMNEMVTKAPLLKGPLATCVSKAIRGVSVSAELLEKNVLSAGYKIDRIDGKAGVFTDVYDKEGQVVAKGYSYDSADSLLHALLGAVREDR